MLLQLFVHRVVGGRGGGLPPFSPRAAPALGLVCRRLAGGLVESGEPALEEVVLDPASLGNQVPASGLLRVLLLTASLGEKPRQAHLRHRIVGLRSLAEPGGGKR